MNDSAIFALHHSRKYRAGNQERTCQINIDTVMPFFIAYLMQWRTRLVSTHLDHARIVNHNIYWSERILDLFYQHIHSSTIG